MCLVLAGSFLDSATAIQLWLSSKTLQVTYSRVIIILHADFKSFSNSIIGMTSHIAINKAMYSASHVESAISL